MTEVLEQQAKLAFREAIAQGMIPRYLYKYTSVENCLRMIKDGTLYFADYHTFNDPFECKAVIDTKNTFDEWNAFLIQNGVPFVEARECALQIASDPKRAEQEIERCVLANQNTTGFLCLTGKNDNLLMWAHYAQQHEGCCVKLDLLNDVDLFFRIKSVDYDNNYLHYNYLRNHGGAFDAICHKSKEWEYEEEYRVMSFNHIGAKEMRSGTLKEVYLGCRIKSEDKQRIISAVSASTKQQDVTVFQTIPDGESYKLNFIKIS